MTERAGEVFELSEVSRGLAVGDLDNDGDSDILLVNNNGPARLLANDLGHTRHWLGLRLRAGRPPREAPGARAALIREGRPFAWGQVSLDGSYASANDGRILFGLGDDPRVDAVRVYWPDGSVEEWSGVEAGRYTTLFRRTGRSAGP